MRIRKRLAAILAAAMLVSLFPVASAQELRPKSNIEQGITLNKQATNFVGWDTNVTLDVVANTNQNPIAIQFVLDATQSMFLDQETGEFYVSMWADTLRMMQDKKIYAGLTIFGETATTVLEPTLLTKDDPLDETALERECAAFVLSQSGTNVQAGIREGLNALAKADSSVADDNKYLVLITDGGSFWRLDETGKAINDTCNEASMQNNDAAELAISGRGDELANSVEELLAANVDTAQVNYTTTSGEPLADVINQIAEADAYTNFEKGIYAAAKELDKVKDAGVNLVTVGYPYYSEDTRLSDLTELAASFVEYAQSKSIENGAFDATLATTNEKLDEIISTMYGQTVNVAVKAGSVITDVIGYAETPELYDFNMLTTDAIRVSLSNANGTDQGGLYNDIQRLNADGSVTFKRDGKDFLTIQYTEGEGENERLTITLHQDLLRGQKLSITYTARLDRYDSHEGTHTVYPNVNAWLTPAGTTDELMFPRPSIDYIIDYPDGGGDGGTDIDDGETPLGPGPDLNTDDHFAYIVGRDDGLVHPLAQIYRSEVASIFFRMLTEDSRQRLWSTENPYFDVDSEDWFNNAISTLTNGGVLKGKPGNVFDPDSPITRAEFATIAVQFFGGGYDGEDLFSDISGHWARDYINRAAALGIISGRGDGTFDPDASITRAEAMSIVNRTLGRAPHVDYLLDDMITWPDNMDTTTWYYTAVQEATNSHDYEDVEVDGQLYEQWTALQPVRDWAALESEWSGTYSSENPGEVMP